MATIFEPLAARAASRDVDSNVIDGGNSNGIDQVCRAT